MTEIQEKLFALQDAGYRDFNAKLLPTVDGARIIGVRTPALRKLAKELLKTADTGAFMAQLPHAYFEENGLHAALSRPSRTLMPAFNRWNAFCRISTTGPLVTA